MREIGSSAAGSGGGRVGVVRAQRGVRGPARASCGRTGSSGAVGDGELCRWAFDARAVRRATFRKSHVTIGGGRRARATSARGDGGDWDAPADDGAERGRGGVRGEAVNGEHVDGETGAARGARGVTPAPTAYPKRTESSTRATVASDEIFSEFARPHAPGNREPPFMSIRVDARESPSEPASRHLSWPFEPALAHLRVAHFPHGRSSRPSRRHRRAVQVCEVPRREGFPPLARRRRPEGFRLKAQTRIPSPLPRLPSRHQRRAHGHALRYAVDVAVTVAIAVTVVFAVLRRREERGGGPPLGAFVARVFGSTPRVSPIARLRTRVHRRSFVFSTSSRKRRFVSLVLDGVVPSADGRETGDDGRRGRERRAQRERRAPPRFVPRRWRRFGSVHDRTVGSRLYGRVRHLRRPDRRLGRIARRVECRSAFGSGRDWFHRPSSSRRECRSAFASAARVHRPRGRSDARA